jgi:hypothetical protein
MSAIESIFLRIQFSVEVGVLLFSVDQEVLLVIYFLSQSLNHIDINFNSASVVFLHSAFLISYSIEALFKIQELVLKIFVVPLSLSKVHGLLSQLCYESILLVLDDNFVVELSIRALRS